MKRLHAGSDGGGKMASSKRRRRFSASEDEDLGSQCTPKRPQSFSMSKIYNSGYRSNKPAELFRKDLISAMKLPDNEQLDPDSFWYVNDTWKQEWERGVQVPVNSQNVPVPCLSVLEKTSKAGSFKLPKKLIRNVHDQFFSNEHHVLTNVAAKAEKICRYDMDDLDCHWLSVFNEQREDYGLSTIDETTMELIIEDLENQCSEKFQEALRTEEGLGIEYDEDVVCDVCRSPDSEEGNEMVFCDSCNICVHQACYGITTIPEGSWICRTCALNIKPQCILCPVMGGAMKSTRSGQKWAHVSCALWIPEVSIGCAEKMEPVVRISQIPASRWALICTLCRERIGACIQCSVKQCKVAYHVTCAFENHLEMKAIFDESGEEDGVKLRSYCPKHSKKTEESTSSNCQYIGSSNNKSRKPKKEVKTSNITDEDKHNARLQKIRMMEAEFDNYVNVSDTASIIEVDANVVDFIFQYWKLKRKANFNKPLITAKADESNLLCLQQENSLYAKTKLFVHLRQDLERVRNLCYMVSRREKMFRSWLKTRENVFWKQVEVLTDKSLELSSDDIKQITEANHSNSIYDIMYSCEINENSKDTYDELKDKLASPRLPNPYAKCYLKGINSRSRRYVSREASMDGSCSSSENVHDSTDSPACPESSTENLLTGQCIEKSDPKITSSQPPVVIKLESEPQSCGTKCILPNGTFDKQKSFEHGESIKKEITAISDLHNVENDLNVNINPTTSWKAFDESMCDASAGRACLSGDRIGTVDFSSSKENTVKRGRGRPRKNVVQENADSNTMVFKRDATEHDASGGNHKELCKFREENSSDNCISSIKSLSNEKKISVKPRRGRPKLVSLDKNSVVEPDSNITRCLINDSSDDKNIKDGNQNVNENSIETHHNYEMHKFSEDSSSNDVTGVLEDSSNDQENGVGRQSSQSKTVHENKNCARNVSDVDAFKEVVQACNSSEDYSDNCNTFKSDPDIQLHEQTEPQFNIHNTRYQMRVRSLSMNVQPDEKTENFHKSSASDSEVKINCVQEETLVPDVGSCCSDSNGGLKTNKNREERGRNSIICELQKFAFDESLNNNNCVSSMDSPSSNDKENIVKYPKGRNKKTKIQIENKDYIVTAVDSVVGKGNDVDVDEHCDDKCLVDVCDKQLIEQNESNIHNTRYQMRVRNQGNNVNLAGDSVEVSLQQHKQPCEKAENCSSAISNSSASCKSSTDMIRSRSSTPLRQSSVDVTEDDKVGPLEIKDSIRIQRRPSRRIWMDREADVPRMFMKVKPEQTRIQDTPENFSDNAVEISPDLDSHSLTKSSQNNNKTHEPDDLETQKLKVSERSLSVTIELLDASLQLPINEGNIATLFPKTETRTKRQFVETPLKDTSPSDLFSNDEISKTHVVENLNHPASPRLVIRLRKDPDCQNWQKGPMPTNGTTAFKVVQNDWDAEDVRKLQPIASNSTFSEDSLSSEIFSEDSHQRNGHRYSMRRRTSKYALDVS